MAKIEVTSISEMMSAAKSISEQAQEFQSAAQNVLNAVNTLAQSWKGDSNDAFVAEQQKANQWYNKMVGIIQTYVSALQNAAKEYQRADMDSASTIKKR